MPTPLATRSLALALLLTGCGATVASLGDGPPIDDTATSGDTGKPVGLDLPADGEGACRTPAELAALADVDHEVLYDGPMNPTQWDAPSVGSAVEDRTYTALLIQYGLEEALADEERPDWTTREVVLVMKSVSSTCGLLTEHLDVRAANPETVLVDLTVRDTRGGCDAACDALGSQGVVVAVPRGSVSTCLRTLDACD